MRPNGKPRPGSRGESLLLVVLVGLLAGLLPAARWVVVGVVIVVLLALLAGVIIGRLW